MSAPLVALVLVLGASACTTIAPPVPRFVAVFEQQSTFCRIQVMKDTRSGTCFVAFKCSRQPVQVVLTAPEVCIP